MHKQNTSAAFSTFEDYQPKCGVVFPWVDSASSTHADHASKQVAMARCLSREDLRRLEPVVRNCEFEVEAGMMMPMRK